LRAILAAAVRRRHLDTLLTDALEPAVARDREAAE
jgi:hypothetical protein